MAYSIFATDRTVYKKMSRRSIEKFRPVRANLDRILSETL